MHSLRVLCLRDLLVQHLLLEHDSIHAPEGGLPKDLKAALRQLTPDYAVRLLSSEIGMDRDGSQLLQLVIQSIHSQNGSPLISITGILTARTLHSETCFKALSAHLFFASSDEVESRAEHVRRVVETLRQPDAVIGILHGS